MSPRSDPKLRHHGLMNLPTETGRLPQIRIRPKARSVRQCSEPVGMIWYVLLAPRYGHVSKRENGEILDQVCG